jgi:hypothetical protein
MTMTRSSSADAESVDGFLRTRRFRHEHTRRIYGHILRAFQYSVTTHSNVDFQWPG